MSIRHALISWNTSTALITRKKELWSIPLLSLGITFSIWALTWYCILEGWLNEGLQSKAPLLIVPAWILVIYFNTFLEVALAHGLMSNGRDPLDDGFAFSSARKSLILQWALINGAAKITLGLLGKQASYMKTTAWLGGMAWSTATLNVPAIIAKGQNPLSSIEESVQIVRNNALEVIGTLGTLWMAFRGLQMILAIGGTAGVWWLVMAQQFVAGIAVGFCAGILIIFLDAIRKAVVIAFACQLVMETDEKDSDK